MLSLLRELVPEPTSEHAKIVAILHIAKIERWIQEPRSGRGRPVRDRKALARAFLAKSILQCSSTERLRHRLMADEGLRISLGMSGRVPSAATFSRAFNEMAAMEMGDKVHEALVRQEYEEVDVWHLARDATALSTWERPASKPKPPFKAKGRPGRKKGVPPKPPQETRQQRQLLQSPELSTAELPKSCSTGTKLDSNGFPHWWNGYKLHADVDDAGFPLAVILTGANVHDSQVAIPLMKTTAQRTRTVFYQLMDAAYVGKPIQLAASQLGQVPIITPKATKTSLAIPLDEDRSRRMPRRSAVERFFAQLKNNYALAQTRYRGHAKVNLQVMIAVIAICAAMILKNAGN